MKKEINKFDSASAKKNKFDSADSPAKISKLDLGDSPAKINKFDSAASAAKINKFDSAASAAKIKKEDGPKVLGKKSTDKEGFRPVGTFSRSERAPEFESKLLDLARVTRVAAGGRRFRFRAVVVIGNKQGKVGIGVAKGLDVAQAVEKATRLAKKNLIEIPIIKNTIPHEVSAKFGPARVLLLPKIKGQGLVAGGTVRVICNLVGIKNISSKILSRTGNKLNNARATIEALKKLKIRE